MAMAKETIDIAYALYVLYACAPIFLGASLDYHMYMCFTFNCIDVFIAHAHTLVSLTKPAFDHGSPWKRNRVENRANCMCMYMFNF